MDNLIGVPAELQKAFLRMQKRLPMWTAVRIW